MASPRLDDFVVALVGGPSRGTLKSFNGVTHDALRNPHLLSAPATDSQRFADPTSRVDSAKRRVSDVWFLRDALDGITRCLDRKWTQRDDRCSRLSLWIPTNSNLTLTF